jgi:lipopolysaccharide transport system permease protein
LKIPALLSAFARNVYQGLAVPLISSIRHRDLLRMLLRREMVNRTSGTFLGMFWPLLQPALQVAGFWFLFDIVYGMRFNRGPDFLGYLLVGILPWLCLTEVLGRAAGMFREFASLYRRTPFPVELLPILVMLIPGMVYTLVYALIIGLMYDVTAALYALMLIPLILLWALPLVLLFSVLGLFARDFAQALPFALMLLMYATPILYFPDMLPETVQGLLWLNPFADLMNIVHALAQAETFPFNTAALVRVTVEWLLLLGPCWLVFRRSLPHIREVL